MTMELLAEYRTLFGDISIFPVFNFCDDAHYACLKD